MTKDKIIMTFFICILAILIGLATLAGITIYKFNTPQPNQEALKKVYSYVESTDVSAAYCVYHLQCIGFTQADAELAVQTAKVDWQQEAIDCAAHIAKQNPDITFEELEDWLELQGFTSFERLKAIKTVYEKGE